MSVSYRERAEQCIRDAEEAIVPELRRLYLAIAQCWLRLAEHSERIQPNELPTSSIAQTTAEANVKKAAAEAASHNYLS